LVIIGWGMGNDDMNLSFDLFQVATMFVAVLLVNYLIADGKSHWLEGWLLICLYSIIAVCSWCKSNLRTSFELSLTTRQGIQLTPTSKLGLPKAYTHIRFSAQAATLLHGFSY
jgi:hypothetical protein